MKYVILIMSKGMKGNKNMKKYILKMTCYDGRIGYATTDTFGTITTNIERAKRFTLYKAQKLLQDKRSKGFTLMVVE